MEKKNKKNSNKAFTFSSSSVTLYNANGMSDPYLSSTAKHHREGGRGEREREERGESAERTLTRKLNFAKILI